MIADHRSHFTDACRHGFAGGGQGEAGGDDGAGPEADQQLVHQPEEAALEAVGGHAVRAHGGRHRRRRRRRAFLRRHHALLRHGHDRAMIETIALVREGGRVISKG